MRIAHFPLNIADQAWRLAGAQRALGHDTVVFSRPTPPYRFDADIPISRYTDPVRFNLGLLHWRDALEDFDVLHIHGGIKRFELGYYLVRGPRVFVHYHGSDIRVGFGRYHQRLADGLFYTPPDLRGMLADGAVWVPQLAPAEVPMSFEPLDRTVFAHFPGRGNKGTDRVIDMFQEAFPGSLWHRFEGHDFFVTGGAELRILRDLPHARVLHEMRFADVVIDQAVGIGIYGAVAVEGMAMGKPVVASLDRSLYPPDCPVIYPRATKLMELARDGGARRHYGEMGRAYAERVHDPLKVARKVLDTYEGGS